MSCYGRQYCCCVHTPIVCADVLLHVGWRLLAGIERQTSREERKGEEEKRGRKKRLSPEALKLGRAG